MSRRYALPEELARHATGDEHSPDELRGVCRLAGEGLGEEDAREARFRSAADMVELWRGLDLPGWEAPYVLREARLGYLRGYERTLVSGRLPEERVAPAARARWGEDWRRRLEAAAKRSTNAG